VNQRSAGVGERQRGAGDRRAIFIALVLVVVLVLETGIRDVHPPSTYLATAAWIRAQAVEKTLFEDEDDDEDEYDYGVCRFILGK